MRKLTRFDAYLRLPLILITISSNVLFFNQSIGYAECLNSPTIPKVMNYAGLRCSSNNLLDWDYPNMQPFLDSREEMIGGNDSTVLYVEGSPGPYTWQVSGTGFTLENGVSEVVTNEPNVTLQTDASACGVATITIADGCGNIAVTKYIRGPGEWILIKAGVSPSYCELGGPYTYYIGGWDFERVSGYQKQVQKNRLIAGGPDSKYSCSFWCGTSNSWCNHQGVPPWSYTCLTGDPILDDYCTCEPQGNDVYFQCFKPGEVQGWAFAYYEWGCP